MDNQSTFTQKEEDMSVQKMCKDDRKCYNRKLSKMKLTKQEHAKQNKTDEEKTKMNTVIIQVTKKQKERQASSLIEKLMLTKRFVQVDITLDEKHEVDQ